MSKSHVTIRVVYYKATKKQIPEKLAKRVFDSQVGGRGLMGQGINGHIFSHY